MEAHTKPGHFADGRLGTVTNHVITLAAKQAEFIVKASLAFLWGELAICSEPIHDIHLRVSTGFRPVTVFVSGTRFRCGSGRSWVFLPVRVWVWLAHFLGFLVGIQDC